MAPPAVPDDILREIFSYLDGRDALHVALSSKHLYDLALPRAAAEATCETPEKLRKLHGYMLSGSPPHAHGLEELCITLLAFEGPDAEAYGDDDYWEFSQARLIGDVLTVATRIRRIFLERLHPLLDADPRIGTALAAMHRLVSANFQTVADATLERLPPLSTNLRVLNLSYFWDEDEWRMEEDGERKTIPPLLKFVAPLRNLHMLELWHFNTPHTPYDEEAISSLSLPSIRNMRLSGVSPSALALVDYCPNLMVLDVSLDYEERIGEDLAEGPRWPRLRSLMLSRHSVVPHVLHRLGTADSVHISDNSVAIGSGAEEEKAVANLFPLLAQTSPPSFSLYVTVGDAPLTFWKRVPTLAPQLRVLELGVMLKEPSLKNKHWLDNIPDALRPLPLVYLSIVVPKTTDVQFPPSRESVDRETGLELDRQYYAAAREVEEHRAQSIASLPERLAAAIPSLRFLTMSVGELNDANLSGRACNGRLRSPWFTLCRRPREIERDMKVRYWRVMDESDGGRSTSRLQELSAAEGERIRALADDVQLDDLVRVISKM